jgi:TPP-dependent pyruvate/acetoin dehydrogenase alpha subunit
MDLPTENLLDMYRTMRRIRRFEDRVGELYLQGRIWGAVHLCTGEEATAVGACAALESGDYITSTHRGHGHCLAMGGDLKLMMAEIYGKATGYCKGKGGSMHIANVDAGHLGANAIVGDGIGIAVGAALASRVKQTDRVSMTFFGDGAVGTGMFHEAVNLASVMKLPAVFVCENNQFAVSTAMKDASPVARVVDRAAAYNIPAVTIDGNDVLAVYQAVKEGVDRAREGGGPSLIEGLTYRWEGHYKGDPEVYRTTEEVAAWREKRDPLVKFETFLVSQDLLTEEQIVEIDQEIEAEIEAAVAFAESSPKPAIESLHHDLYVDRKAGA